MQDHSEIAQRLHRFMRRLHSAMHAHPQGPGAEQVPPQAMFVLLTLADNQPMSMQGLADALARDKSQITRLVRELENRGLIGRSRDPGDARVALLRLTDDGVALLARLQTAMKEVLGDILAPLTPAEKTAFSEILHKL